MDRFRGYALFLFGNMRFPQMFVMVFTILILTTIYALVKHLHQVYYLLSLSISCCYYFKEYSTFRVGPNLFGIYEWRRRELIHQIMFIFWLYCYGQRNLLLFLPLTLSNLGKVCLIILRETVKNEKKRSQYSSMIQNIIFLQSVTEVLMVFDVGYFCLCGNWSQFDNFTFLIGLLQIRYLFYWHFSNSMARINILIRKLTIRMEMIDKIYEGVRKKIAFLEGPYFQELTFFY